MRIMMYFGDINRTLDASHPELGNFGVGGTPYQFILLAYYLAKDTRYEISIISESEIIPPANVNFIRLKEPKTYIAIAEKYKADFLILRNNNDKDIQRQIELTNVRIIIWGHNYYFADYCKWVARTSSIKANIFVGKQQYDRYIDHEIITKSKTIFNMLPDFVGDTLSRQNDAKTVVYMGALVPVKGFAELSKIWNKITKAVPDAQLLVLGNGKLYNENQTLGKYGLAEESYEKQFMKYLTDSKGQILNNVKFLGIVGQEKYEIFSKASVGVVNPSARTETFGVAVIEMALAQLPVVTLNKNGYPDTIVSGETGFLANSLDEIANKIIYLLQNREENKQLGLNAKKRVTEFSPELIVEQWKDVFNSTVNKKNIKFNKPVDHFRNNLKWIRVAIRFLRFNLKLKFLPSLIDIETFVYNILRRYK